MWGTPQLKGLVVRLASDPGEASHRGCRLNLDKWHQRQEQGCGRLNQDVDMHRCTSKGTVRAFEGRTNRFMQGPLSHRCSVSLCNEEPSPSLLCVQRRFQYHKSLAEKAGRARGESRASDNTHVCQAHPRHHLHRETRRPPPTSASMPAGPFLPAHRDSDSVGMIVSCAQLASRARARQGQRGPRNVIRKKPTQNADIVFSGAPPLPLHYPYRRPQQLPRPPQLTRSLQPEGP